MRRNIRSALIVLVALLRGFLVPAQEGGPPGKQENLYSLALAASVIQMEKEWGYIDDGNHGSRMRTDYRHVRVRKNPAITDDLPADFGDRHAEYLDDQSLIERYKTQRKEFAVLEVHPMRNVGSELKIQISVSWVSLQKGRLILAFSDWSDVEFRYDCEKQAFAISTVTLGGI